MTPISSLSLRIASLTLLLAAIDTCIAAAELCQGCSARRAMLSDAEITEIRIEQIKQQILKKLRITEPPKIEPDITPLSLPEPLRLPDPQTKFNAEDDNYDDDYYGKLEEIVLFPSDGGFGCDPSVNSSTICLLFQLPAELEGLSVKSAVFWLHKEQIHDEESARLANSTAADDELVVAEESHLNGAGIRTQLLNQGLLITDGWVKADVTLVVKKWEQVQNGTATYHKMYIICTSCSTTTRPPVSLETNLKPFLTISMDNYSKSRRQKRNINCSPGIEECCRENLNISFAALGWDEWIVSPKFYNAYQCKGTCSPPTSITIGNYYHNVIKQYANVNPNEKVVSCCTAEKFSGLDIIYKGEKGNIYKQILPKMVVESCACV